MFSIDSRMLLVEEFLADASSLVPVLSHYPTIKTFLSRGQFLLGSLWAERGHVLLILYVESYRTKSEYTCVQMSWR